MDTTQPPHDEMETQLRNLGIRTLRMSMYLIARAQSFIERGPHETYSAIDPSNLRRVPRAYITLFGHERAEMLNVSAQSFRLIDVWNCDLIEDAERDRLMAWIWDNFSARED